MTNSDLGVKSNLFHHLIINAAIFVPVKFQLVKTWGEREREVVTIYYGRVDLLIAGKTDVNCVEPRRAL